MIDTALLNIIRRWHFRERIPIREIERRTELSCNTIRKHLRAGTIEPRLKVPDRPSKLDPFAESVFASRSSHTCPSYWDKFRTFPKKCHLKLLSGNRL